MFTTFASVVVILCTMLFCLFYFVSVVFFKESYYIKKIEINDIKKNWNVLSDYQKYYSWWRKFYYLKDEALLNKILIDNSFEENKFSFNLSSDNLVEKWSFYFQKYSNTIILVIKIDTKTNSFWSKLFFQYWKNKKEVKNFLVDLNNYNLIQINKN